MAIFSPENCQKIPFLRLFLGFLLNIRDMSLFSVSYVLIGPGQLDLATAKVRRTQNLASEATILLSMSKNEISGPK